MSKKQASLTKGAALRSVPRLFAAGEQFDTRSVRSVFSDVHAAGENDQNYFCLRAKTLRGLFDSDKLAPPAAKRQEEVLFITLSKLFLSR